MRTKRVIRNMAREVKEFLNMNLEELYDYYVSFVLAEPESKTIIEELIASERYASDAQFRAIVDFSAILKDAVSQDYKKLDFSKRIIKCIDIIERTSALELWQFAANSWNILALSYSNLLMYERALECFSHGLRIEREQGLYKLSPIMYTNMADIFMKIGEFEKALSYIETSARILGEHEHEMPRYWDKFVGIYSRYLFLKIRKGQYKKEDLKPYYDKIMSMPESGLNFNTNRSKLATQLYYGFFYSSEEEVEQLFKESRELFGLHQTLLFCQECIDLARQTGKEEEKYKYIHKLIELEREGRSHLHFENMTTYDILMEYYEEKGDEAKLSEYRVKYINSVKAHLKDLSEQQIHSINTIEQLVMSDEFKMMNNIKNVEFKLIADETLRAKRELEEANKILAKISSLDGLTQISSRRDFEERIKELMARAMEEKLSLSIFMLDIDYFKRYNDTYGHLEGDKVLKKVARSFRRHFNGKNQLSARFGGEEFIGAATGLSLEEAEELAKKICTDVEKLEIEHRAVRLGHVTVSLGVAIVKDVKPGMKSELMRLADECLYAAKAAGRNTFVLDVLPR